MKRRRCTLRPRKAVLRQRIPGRSALGVLAAAAIERLEPRQLLSKTIDVYASAPGPTHDGTTWTTAYFDLQQALAAAVSGDQIHVAHGTYKPTATINTSISFNLKNGVAIYGGYAGFGAASPDARDTLAHPSVLSGDIGAVGNNADNSLHVLTATSVGSSTILDGVTITAGNATGGGVGAGMFNTSASPQINNCTFIANVASFGGGMFNNTSSSPSLTHCIFVGNTASGGGGIQNQSSSPVLEDCTFVGNIASSVGGGMFDESSSAPVIDRCTFIRNDGGGIDNDGSSITVTTCVFDGNIDDGVEILDGSATFINCVFCGTKGDAALLCLGSSSTLINCTFCGNFGGGIQIGKSLTLSNCIMWADFNSTLTGELIGSGTLVCSNSDIDGGPPPGAGNIATYPQFDRLPS
jgi:hypothetical protein